MRFFNIHASEGDDGIWDVNVEVNGSWAGEGTGRYPLAIADDILYGDKNDWLNDYFGALGKTRDDSA